MEFDLEKNAQKIKDRLAFLKVKDFEIFIEAKEGMNLEVREGKRDACEIKAGLAFGLRVFQDQKMAFSYGSDFSDSAIDFVIKQCQHAIVFQTADPHYELAEPQILPPSPTIEDPLYKQIGYQEKLDFLTEMEKKALGFDQHISEVKYASLDDEIEFTWLENSRGICLEQVRTAFCASLGVQAQKSNSQEISYEMDMQVAFKDLDGAKMARLAANHAVQLLEGRSLGNYKGPVVFYGDVVAEFLDILVSSFMGDNIDKKNSCLVGKKGQNIYSPTVTLIDDGLLAGSAVSGAFDGEGVPRQTLSLIEKGQVKSFLYDTYWGRRCGEKSTGNATREDVTCQPDLSYHNLCLQPGTLSLEALLKQMHNGLLILDVIGLHNADEVSGDVSMGVQGLEIKNGEPVGAFRSMVLSSNIHQIFKDLLAVGSDYKLCGGLGAASILVDKMAVSGAS